MKRYIYVLSILGTLAYADDTINAQLQVLQQDLNALKASGVATAEEIDALSKKVSVATADINQVKTDLIKPKEVIVPAPQTQQYQHCVCTHYETGGTSRMQSYGQKCHISGGYMPRSLCQAKSTTSSPDLQLICDTVPTPDLLPPYAPCVYFTT